MLSRKSGQTPENFVLIQIYTSGNVNFYSEFEFLFKFFTSTAFYELKQFLRSFLMVKLTNFY